MNLCIDQGNTYTKIALFEAQKLKKSMLIDATDYELWNAILAENNITNTIISSVRDIDPALESLLRSKSAVLVVLNHTTPIPIINLYKTPDTLGKDRLAGVIGAYTLQPGNDILVVDAGTALTFDFINKEGEYFGGTIAPGMDMRFQALNTFTSKLPLVHAEGESPLLGITSEQAIRSGVVNGMIYEIEGYVNNLTSTYPELLIFLTGGNCFFFESKLKSVIFVNQNLVLIGLNSIIDYNAKISKN